ncbi:unnamed protein product [Alternaria alternata]
MARGPRNKANRANKRAGASTASHRGSQAPPFNNTYESLEQLDCEYGELNASLTERFRSMPFNASRNVSVPHDDIPMSEPFRVNNDIREYFELAKKPVTGGAWLHMPEIPNPSEVLCEKSESNDEALIEVDERIRPHKPKGAYDDNEDYLRTNYELLREDAVRPLREAIDEVRADPFKNEAEYRNQSIGVYDPVYITSLVFSPRGLATRVAFSLSRVKKYIRWEQSKRLITGTLVALSPTDDAFQTQCVLAIVAARPLSALEQNPPEIDLFFARPEDQEIDPMRKWIMVECRSSFFEASKHTLLALQHLMREPFPMSKYLVHVQKEVDPPAYIKHNPYVNLSSLVSIEEGRDYENVNVLEDWPTTSSHSLDNSQSRALKRILTSELAIIQGPPGTGKTFVSVVALQIACNNLRKEDAPIIVTAQTNHALDQLLRHTSQFEPNYIRLGGRSKDKEIKKRTLFEVRSELPRQKQPGSQKAQATIAIRKLTTQLQVLLAPLEVNKVPLDHKLLRSLGLITRDQAESLEMESQCTMGVSPSDSPGILMEQWLGRCLAPCDRPIGPEQFDWGYEEDDFEVEQLKELEAEAVAQDDDDIEALPGPLIQLSDNWKGTGNLLSNADIQDILRKTDDLTTIRVADRGTIYNYFKREAKKLIVIEIRKLAKLYQEAVVQRKVGMWEEDVRVLSKARIIGCTTTGLAKYRALLCALRPRICVVEEAAETLEAPVTAACFPSLEHLVLVGDHQQLRPHTQVRAFEDKPYFLNLSLFERLVCNDVAFDTLTRQRRMIPEIRRLLYPIYQDTLKDHKSVKDLSNRPPVEGMGGNNSFFFCHDWQETRDTYMSALNPMEAHMIVQFFDYLVLNGVDATKITVLTFYNGQRKEIMRRLRAHPNLRGGVHDIQVVTVDSYQGEENDIVLLSLVRSNHKHSIGFLNSENRACVALSRAKRGFYIFGNAELLACESGTWASVIEIMWRNKKVRVTIGQERRIGYQFPLECSNHGRRIWCEVPEDFELIKGGCDIKCQGSLPCGHRCPYPCHSFEHHRINCTQKCSRRLETCGHPCIAECCDPCKCHMCDRRSGGVKSTLKPVNGAAPFRGARPNTQSLMLEDTLPGPGSSKRGVQTYAPTQRMTTPGLSDCTTVQWDVYANGGGVQEDDARAYAKMQVEALYYAHRTSTPGTETTGGKLIELLPEKDATVSKNTGLLLDLDVEPLVPESHPQTPRSYANAAKPYVNLLD